MLRVTHVGQMAMKNQTQISESRRIHGYPCLEVGRPPPRYSATEASRSCCCRSRSRESASAESLRTEPGALTYSKARVGSGLRRRVNRTRLHCSSVLVEGVALGVWMTFEREIG